MKDSLLRQRVAANIALVFTDLSQVLVQSPCTAGSLKHAWQRGLLGCCVLPCLCASLEVLTETLLLHSFSPHVPSFVPATVPRAHGPFPSLCFAALAVPGIGEYWWLRFSVPASLTLSKITHRSPQDWWCIPKKRHHACCLWLPTWGVGLMINREGTVHERWLGD